MQGQSRPYRRFNRAHSALASCIALLFCQTTHAQIQSNGLIGYWQGDGNAEDSSSLHNNGSFTGSYDASAPFGQVFNLATAHVVIPAISQYHFTNYPGWSVGFWFNTNGVNYSQMTFLGQDDGPGYQPKWFIDYGYTVYSSNTDFVWHVNDYNQERIFLTSNSVSPLPSGWNQVTVTINAQDVTFYLDGLNIGAVATPSYVLNTTSPLEFGYLESGLGYSGLMADVVLYDRVLSSGEVKDLAQLPATTPEPSSVCVFGVGLGCLLVSARQKWRGTR
jgi:hypothetical protein